MPRVPLDYHTVKVVMLAGDNPIPNGAPLLGGEERLTLAVAKDEPNKDRKLHRLALFHTDLPLRGHEVRVYVVTEHGDREVFWDS